MKSRNLFIRGLLVCLGVVSISASCSRRDAAEAPSTTHAADAEKVSLRLKWIPTAGFAGDFLALENGYFAKEGLVADVRAGGPEANPVALVAGGADDFGVAGADAVLLARAKGVPLVAIAAVFQRNAAGFFTKKETGPLAPQGWKGKKVGLIPGNDTETVFKALLARHKIGLNELSVIPIGFDLTPFLTGRIDVQPGYISNQPNLLRAQGVEVEIMDPQDFGVRMLGNVYFTTEKVLAERPEVVQRFVRAVVSAWTDTIRDPDASLAALLKADPKLNADAQRAVLRDTIPFLTRPDGRVGWMDREAWAETEQTLRDSGALKEPVDISTVFTTKFLQP